MNQLLKLNFFLFSMINFFNLCIIFWELSQYLKQNLYSQFQLVKILIHTVFICDLKHVRQNLTSCSSAVSNTRSACGPPDVFLRPTVDHQNLYNERYFDKNMTIIRIIQWKFTFQRWKQHIYCSILLFCGTQTPCYLNCGPRTHFKIHMRHAGSFFFKMRPLHWFEFETLVVHSAI